MLIPRAINFVKFKIITSDIWNCQRRWHQKAFFQMNLQEIDGDVPRFIWLKDIKKPVVPSHIDISRFTRISVEIISSPFILAFTVVYHLQSKEGPIAEKLITDNNLITGTNPKDAVLQIYEQGKQMLKEISMN